MNARALFWKARLGLYMWVNTFRVWVLLKTRPLPDLAALVTQPTGRSRRLIAPRRLSRAVDRVLHIGSWQPRCLTRSLVLCLLVARQGARPTLVIGLPNEADGPGAHAWVELEGVDIGPAPGGYGHTELARY